MIKNLKFPPASTREASRAGKIQNFKEIFDWKLGLFLLAIAVGIFLRVYQFGDWLYFKLDQARDAFVISNAYFNGPGALPLLGPRAGGTTLLLGPAYYYFQYFALLLTRNLCPTTYALPDITFSILSIPLFYIFLKKYFSRDWSLGLASAYAVCFFAIEYSRFAWNPNPLPFFTILYFFSILNALDERSCHPWIWLTISAVALAIATQLHFLAFLALPTVTILFLVFSRKQVKKTLGLGKIIFFIGIFLFSYLPWILNDLSANWKNTRLFWKAVLIKLFSATLLEDIITGMANFAHNWLVVLTGYLPGSKNIAIALAIWIVFVIPAIYAGFRLYRSEKDFAKKSFILLSILWILVFLVIDIPIGHQLWPRFFMGTLVIPFIFLGYYLQYFTERIKRFRAYIFVAALTIVIAGNIWGTLLWFQQIKTAQKGMANNSRTFVFKDEDGVVLWHINKIAEYMQKSCPNGKIFFSSASIYVKPIIYMSRYNKGELNKDQGSASNQKICYFGIVRASVAGLKDIESQVGAKFSVKEQQQYGELRVMRIIPQSSDSADLSSKFHNIEDDIRESKTDRLYWKDVVL
ncbi:MAG: glycosyltransferase family 39 protein [Parcubacteria group bacterium]